MVKSTGDGVLAVFADPSAAVACAVDVQRAVADREWTGIGRLGVRVGIHTGRCSLIDGDVLGRPPNLAARLESAGHGGQILVSGDTAAACAGRLAAGVELQGLGAYTMRGFDDPVEVHVVRADGLITEFPPPRAAYRGFEDLPPDDRPLVGRSAAIRLAVDAVGGCAVVTLWGPAGVGKTRLAVRVANAARHPFDDGIRFVDLTTTGGSRTVADAVLDALRVQPATGESTVDTLRRAVRSLRILLVLDNCEHVLDDVRAVVELIVAASPGTHVLCTSREPLGLAGEATMPVAPLAEDDAVRLLLSRVAEVRPEFRITASTGDAVRRICADTDGLPYAIELAAAQVVVEGVEAAAATPGLGASSAVGGAGLDGRLDRSLATLDPSASALLTQLAAFVGPFSHDLARAVAPGCVDVRVGPGPAGARRNGGTRRAGADVSVADPRAQRGAPASVAGCARSGG